MPIPTAELHAGHAPARPGLVTNAVSGALLPLLLLLFIGSGCAALIYEIVWFQMLQLVIGSSAWSIGVLLGTFMGGMCLGSLLFSRLVSRRAHPLKVYALLEISIGVVALLVTILMPLFDYLYIALAIPGGTTALALRAAVCAICLLPPTMLMGATLPAISRWVETSPRGVAWLGFFYGGNTAGAVVGCLLAGFYLLRNFDMRTASYFAVAINITVGLIGLLLSKFAAATPVERQPATAPASAPALPDMAAPQESSLSVATIYMAIALSGMSALGAEVVWTRLLSLLLGSTVYTFSIILAVFLTGLGIGSSVGAMWARGWSASSGGMSGRLALAWSQILCGIGIAWSAFAVTNGISNWPVSPFIAINTFYQFQLDLARCFWAILPATLFWGASFPFALAAATGATRAAGVDPARTVGRVYAANTVGAILGALLFSLFFIPTFQTPGCEKILIGLTMLGGIAALVGAYFPASSPYHHPSPADTDNSSPSYLNLFLTLVAAVVIPFSLLAVYTKYPTLDEVPDKLVAWGRQMWQFSRDNSNDEFATTKVKLEGINSTVAVTEDGNGYRKFHVSGKCEASTLPVDMRLQLMLGHYPALFHKEPKSVLIVGCGAGVTAGCFIVHPEVQRIVICEIEPLIPQVVATWFSQQNNDVVTRKADGTLFDKRVEIVYDDARHYILTTKEKFDIITSDPIHPWVKGAATLYTKDYFELVKQHLNPGGLVTQWVPLYESSEAVVKSEIATFFQVFPHGTVWNNADSDGSGYDTIIMGGDAPMKIDVDALNARLEKRVIASALLAKSGIDGSLDILRTYAGNAADLAGWMQDAEINYDRNLRLQYLAGESLYLSDATKIANAILTRRTYPKDMLTAPEAMRTRLRTAWRLPPE